MNLFRRSIDIILENQSPDGAYIASPNFPTYAYCWFRDSSYIAHSMDIAGEHSSARAFFRWTDNVISRYAYKVKALEKGFAAGESLTIANTLNTRYTLTGEELEDGWENFQLDGYGTWLWALNEHLKSTPDPAFCAQIKPSVETIIRYLSEIWDQPNYDCWEEAAEFIHTHTLAAIYAGLKAGAEIVEGEIATQARLQAAKVRAFIDANCLFEGRLVKSIHPSGTHTEISQGVDASLIGAAVPFAVYDHRNPAMQSTITKIEEDLHRQNGGVYRYQQDTYYGGGEWVLLAGWLGWHYALAGERDRANKIKVWMEKQVDDNGWLPEQNLDAVLSKIFRPQWEERWGPVANPLLWSHAMYIILYSVLENSNAG